MDFRVDPSFEKLRTMIHFIGRERLRPLGLEADAQHGPLPSDHPFFKEVLDMGLTGGFVGRVGKKGVKDDGRVRRSARRAVVMAEEAAYWDRGMATSLPGPGLGGTPVILQGSDEQRERFIAPFSDSSQPRWASFAMTEPDAGSDVARIRTRLRLEGDEVVIDGSKCFISNGARATFALVWGTTDPALGRAGHRAVIVPQGTPGFEVVCVERKMGLHASETASLAFENCRVPASHLLPAPEGGFRTAMRTFDITRPMVAAMAVGIGRAAWDEALRFARERFTGPSAWRRERVLDRLVRMRRKLETGRLLAWKSAWQADHREQNGVMASMAKAQCASFALEAASLGIEVLGEAGGARDRLIEKLFRDVKALDIVEGTGQIQRRVIARRLIGTTEVRNG